MLLDPKPALSASVEHGNQSSWWIEYPSGLVDLTRSHHLTTGTPLLDPNSQFELSVDVDRAIRVNKAKTALIVIDMQNFFLHPELITHSTGLACVDPLLATLPALRSLGVKILWVNWGLTETELTTIPPALVRGFHKFSRGGSFGSPLVGNWGRMLMRTEPNSDLYGPLQDQYINGLKDGTDVWIHKNRMSGLWGPQTALNLYLQENGIETLLFAGVNADQCVLGTLADAYFLGYDCILVKDATATTSPDGGYENVVYNVYTDYGFTTDSASIVKAAN